MTLDDLEPDEEIRLRGLWLSRLMFGWMVGMEERRPYEDWLASLSSVEKLLMEKP